MTYEENVQSCGERAQALLDRGKPEAVAAEAIRRMAGRDDLDPWLAFPQGTCCFTFGEGKRPLPIGALRLLWAAGWPWTQPCPACDGTLHAVGFGGLLSKGGTISVCPGCGRSWFQQIGGLGTMADLVRSSPIAGTEFRLGGGMFGGAASSDGAALLQALGMAPPGPRAGRSEVYYCVIPQKTERPN